MVPEIVKFTIKNFMIILAWSTAILAFAFIGVFAINFSNYYLGNPFFGAVLIFLIAIMFISFKMAQVDVKVEDRKREQLLEELKKD